MTVNPFASEQVYQDFAAWFNEGSSIRQRMNSVAEGANDSAPAEYEQLAERLRSDGITELPQDLPIAIVKDKVAQAEPNPYAANARSSFDLT